MKRVLALHGHSHSAQYFKYKLNAIRDACQENIEFVFVDAPHILNPVDLPGAVASGPSDPLSLYTINGCPARAWWRFLYDMRDDSAVIESFQKIQTVLETQGPFHGMIGFSQGAALAAMILGYMENPQATPNLLPNIKHPPFEFAVMISGFVAPSKAFPIPARIRTPSLHVIGFNDVMVSPEQSIELTSHFDNAQIEIHQGGHFVPRKLTWRRFLCDYLNSRASVPGKASDYIRAPTPPRYREELLGNHGIQPVEVVAC
ncbi:serine hydrolase FSH [Mycena epipterygia]|nr:serine hydrolase FSH [Mycena epipterygia]